MESTNTAERSYKLQSIQKLQNYLKTWYIINHDFNELQSNQYKLSKGNIFVFIVFFSHFIKFTYDSFMINRKSSIVSNLLGNFFNPFNQTGISCCYALIMCALWATIMMYALIRIQYENKCDALSDLGMFIHDDIDSIQYVDGKQTIGRTKLPIESYQKFTKMTNILILAPKSQMPTGMLAGGSLYATGIYFSYQDDQDIHLLIYRSLWGIFSTIFLFYHLLWYPLQGVIFQLSSEYLKLRFEQLKNEMKDIIAQSTNIESDIEANELSFKLNRFLDSFNKLCDRVHRYNHTYRYFLFCISLCGMGLFITCFLIMYPRNENSIEKYIKWPLGLSCIITNLLIAFFASVAGNVHSSTKSFYPGLNSLMVNSMKSNILMVRRKSIPIPFDIGNEYNWFDNSVLKKLRSIIERISSDKYPVSFYNLDLHPFTHLSFANLVLATSVNMLLALQLLRKISSDI